MQFRNLVILLGYKKDKLEETRLTTNDDISKQLTYMAEYNSDCTTIEELRVESNGTTVYWQTHRVSELIPNKG